MELLTAVKIICIDYYGIYSILSYVFIDFFSIKYSWVGEIFSHSLPRGIRWITLLLPAKLCVWMETNSAGWQINVNFQNFKCWRPPGACDPLLSIPCEQTAAYHSLTLFRWWHLQMTPLLFGGWQVVIHILPSVNRVSRVSSVSFLSLIIKYNQEEQHKGWHKIISDTCHGGGLLGRSDVWTMKEPSLIWEKLKLKLIPGKVQHRSGTVVCPREVLWPMLTTPKIQHRYIVYVHWFNE